MPFGQGRPVWVDDPHFNTRYHVQHHALPAPGGEEELKQLAGRAFSQQLDRNKPLWELWLVEGLSDGRFALLGKTHHALVDGISGVDITTVLFDLTAEPPAPPSPDGPWVRRAAADQRPAARRRAAGADDRPGRDRARHARLRCARRGGC